MSRPTGNLRVRSVIPTSSSSLMLFECVSFQFPGIGKAPICYPMGSLLSSHTSPCPGSPSQQLPTIRMLHLSSVFTARLCSSDSPPLPVSPWLCYDGPATPCVLLQLEDPLFEVAKRSWLSSRSVPRPPPFNSPEALVVLHSFLIF